MTELSELTQARTKAANLRLVLEKLEAQREDLLEQLLETDLYRQFVELNEGIRTAKKASKKADDELRKAAVRVYESSRAKKPIDGVSIRERVVVDIDEEEADAWCRKHMPQLLVVDFDRLAKLAKSDAHIVPDNVATVTTEPQVYLSRDLSKYADVKE